MAILIQMCSLASRLNFEVGMVRKVLSVLTFNATIRIQKFSYVYT
jgi:hypothetical protein